MRILVTGVSGMLGSSLAIELSKKHDVFGTGNSLMNIPITYKVFDLSQDSYGELIQWSQPEVIVHCAALTHGNYCQENVLEAFNINGYSLQKFMNATDDNVKIIYISTDAVFPSRLHMAKETDCPSPESVYGKSKELGEFFLLNSERNFTIVRTTIVGFNSYRNKQGFLEWIINSAKSDEEISLFDDVLFTPITIWDLIKEIDFILDKGLYEEKVLHIAGGEACTKYAFGIAMLEALSLSTDKVKKGYISRFVYRAKRSNDQTLSTDFYQKKFLRELPSLTKTIESIKTKYHEIDQIRK